MNKYKPTFHITGLQGWINDPNGLVKFNNQYHIFFQYHPYSTSWGPMHWGHVVSDDLLHFSYLPNALTPGDDFDKDGCFSGTSFVKDGTLYVAYTGFINNEDPTKIRQIQCLASSKDGINFEKHGAIITEEDLPSQYKPTDFRDPKLFYKDGAYYILACTKKVSGGGSILAFKSLDLKKWEFVNDVLPFNSEGEMLECVDYHQDLNLLLFSEQCFPADNQHCLNVHSCEYLLGDFEKDFKFVPKGNKTLIDYGFDFYAPQIISNDNYLFGWLNMWDRNNPSEKYGFAGMLTCPRKVSIEDNKLIQTPLMYGKLESSYQNKENVTNHIEVGTIKIEVEDLKSLSIDLRVGEDEVTKFYLDGDKFYFDRSKSGEKMVGAEKDEYSLKGIRVMPYFKKDKDVIYLVMDKYSIEIFVNGISMSNLVYPKETSDGLNINIGSATNKIEIYK